MSEPYPRTGCRFRRTDLAEHEAELLVADRERRRLRRRRAAARRDAAVAVAVEPGEHVADMRAPARCERLNSPPSTRSSPSARRRRRRHELRAAADARRPAVANPLRGRRAGAGNGGGGLLSGDRGSA